KSTLRASARYPMCCSRPIWYSLTPPAPDWKISCDMPRMLDILGGKFPTRSIKGHPHPLVCASSSREYMKPFAILLVAFVLLSSTLLGCRRSSSSSESEGAPAAPWFADVSEQAGLSFVHDAGRLGNFFMPQIMGSGAALFDANGDNLLDIYLLQNGGPHGARNRLYLQSPNHTFRDASEGSGLDIPGYNMGVAVGDVNNDGRPDVLVTGYDGVQLFRNNGKGVFTNITAESGLNNPAWATSAAFVDYDRDGWLDLVVVNYLDYDPTWPCYGAGEQRDYCPPRRFKGRATKLFRNLGPGAGREEVRFEDVTV